MKYKIKHEKSNLMFMSSVLILSLVTCIFWIILREYIYFSVFFILTIFIGYIYYFTFYYIDKKYLIIKLGFIKVKIKYDKIKDIEKLEKSIKLNFKNISMNIYPNNIDIFYTDLKSKMKGI